MGGCSLQFDAPYGQALCRHVEHVSYTEEEVFIDAIAKDTTVFLMLTYQDAMQVDIELNGQVKPPRAMRIPTTLTRFPEQE